MNIAAAAAARYPAAMGERTDCRPAPASFAVLCLLAGVLLSISINFSPDSMHYLDIARNLVAGEGLTTFHLNLHSASVPDAALMWPPLYPILLAVPLRCGLSPETAVRLALILSFVLAALTLHALARRLAGGSFAFCAMLSWLLLAATMEVWSAAWSEGPFLALIGFFLIACAGCLDRYATRQGVAMAFLAGALGGLAMMTRYLGAACLVCGIVSLTIHASRRPAGRNTMAWIAASVAMASGFALVAAPWVIRNHLHFGSSTALTRPLSQSSQLENTMAAMTDGLAPLWIPLGAGVLLMAVLVARGRPSAAPSLAVVTVSLSWLICYIAALLITTSSYEVDPVGPRFLAPVHGAILLLLLFGVERVLAARGLRLRVPGRAVVLVSFAVIVGFTVKCVRSNYAENRERFTIVEEPLAWIREQTPERALFIGRNAWWIRFFAGRIVLESGYPTMPPLTTDGIARFLARFGSQFEAIYLYLRPAHPNEAELDQEFRKVGYRIAKRAEINTLTFYEVSVLSRDVRSSETPNIEH